MRNILDISRYISANFRVTVTGQVALFAMNPVIIPQKIEYIGHPIPGIPEASPVNKSLSSLPHFVSGILIPMPHDIAIHILEDAQPSKQFFYQLYVLLQHSKMKVLLSLLEPEQQTALKNAIEKIDTADEQTRPELVNCIKWDIVKATIKQARTWKN
jgi:hypothetical protein